MALKIDTRLVLAALVIVTGLCACQATSGSLNDELSISERHEQWMARYGRVYRDDVEKAKRFKIFNDNVDFIESFNKAGTKPYKIAVNEFADLTNEEFLASRTGYKPSPHQNSSATLFRYEDSTADVPKSKDWRKEGAVTDVKNQKRCGSCWAFSAVAAAEGIHQIKTGKLISLSEQQLVDCARSGESHGCKGGFMDDAFKYIIQNKGLATESSYPYTGVEGTCNENKQALSAVKITGYEDVPENSESALRNAVARQPVSVAIDASGSAFHFYKSGIFTEGCGTELNHGVTVVGYGTSADGINYWLVKNSWGTGWGEDGYIRIARDIDAEEGLCGIAMKPSYPTA